METPTHKICTKCFKNKPLEEYSQHKEGKYGKKPSCRDCFSIAMKNHYNKNKNYYMSNSGKWKKANPEKYKKSANKCVRTVKSRYRALIKTADDRKKILDIDFDTYKKLINENKCHYCEQVLPETGTGLDRKDPSIGYIVKNVVPCCYRCNLIKMDKIPFEVMVALKPSLVLLNSTINKYLSGDVKCPSETT